MDLPGFVFLIIIFGQIWSSKIFFSRQVIYPFKKKAPLETGINWKEPLFFLLSVVSPPGREGAVMGANSCVRNALITIIHRYRHRVTRERNNNTNTTLVTQKRAANKTVSDLKWSKEMEYTSVLLYRCILDHFLVRFTFKKINKITSQAHPIVPLTAI